jgi:hypothetical protein
MLGLLWTKEDLTKPRTRPDAGVEELMIPLATVIDPKLTEGLKAFISKAKDKQGRPIKELGQLGREDFLKFYSQHTTMKTGEEPS